MKVSDLFVKCLENEGVQHIFGVPGEETEDLLFSLANSTIKFIPTRHEQGAAFMADVWGRLTGRAGVCLSTLGPGATNLMTGIADAKLDKSPLVAITGQGALTRGHHESHQVVDVVRMFRPITKWNTAITDSDIVPEAIRKAFKVAEEEKPGPTHIELSEDMAKRKSSMTPLPPRKVRRPAPDPLALGMAVELLQKAKRPLVIAGNGAIRKMASQNLKDFVACCGIPVANTFMGKGAISGYDEHALLTIGLGMRDYVMEAVEGADLILTVGYDLSEFPPEKWNPKKDKTIIHIDFTSADIYAHYEPHVEIVADISATLILLVEKMKTSQTSFDQTWFKPIREKIIKDINSYTLKDGEPFTVPGVINILHDIMKEQDILISDVGSHKMWIARNFITCCPNGCLISNGLASMGFAVPGAVAAAMVDPKRHIVAVTGDGGFLMNSQELETAKRLGLAFTVIIVNDNEYSLISWKQEMHHGKSVGTRLTNPDFKKYAESFGITGYKPATLSELKDNLREAITGGQLSVVEVAVDSAVNFELTKKLKKSERSESREGSA